MNYEKELTARDLGYTLDWGVRPEHEFAVQQLHHAEV